MKTNSTLAAEFVSYPELTLNKFNVETRPSDKLNKSIF
ncbi:hypothetical protein LEP1GSC088_2835 [Leptospira interrogans str. L1207]|nr:hypothetical protein LEP1GSC088_2835 [Leptospira interrogans str. L1207]